MLSNAVDVWSPSYDHISCVEVNVNKVNVKVNANKVNVKVNVNKVNVKVNDCLLYTSPSPRD